MPRFLPLLLLASAGCAHPALVLNDTDFVDDAEFSPGGDTVALLRRGEKTVDLQVWSVAGPGPVPVCETAINPLPFDVESLAFSPVGRAIATAGRDGTVRVYQAGTCALLGAWRTEAPLVTVAFHPEGHFLVVGDARGVVTVLAVEPTLHFASDLRVHRDAVRGLAFAPDGTLYTGAWDQTVAVLSGAERPADPNSATLRFARAHTLALVHGAVNGAPVVLALDPAVPPMLALRQGLPAPAHLRLKGLTFDAVEAAVCAACVPDGADGVLGAGFAELVAVAVDDDAGEVLLQRKGPGLPAGAPVLAFSARTRFQYPAFINDLTVDASGRVLGLAVSEAKAERTPGVWARGQRGQRREPEPERAWDAGLRVDAATGALLEKVGGHRGVVATAAVSPDGQAIATGGWDRQVRVTRGGQLQRGLLGWGVRRVRFSPDGRRLAAAGWTPKNPAGGARADPSALVWELAYP